VEYLSRQEHVFIIARFIIFHLYNSIYSEGYLRARIPNGCGCYRYFRVAKSQLVTMFLIESHITTCL